MLVRARDTDSDFALAFFAQARVKLRASCIANSPSQSRVHSHGRADTRWWRLFFLATVLCYVDRVSISVAIIPLSHDRGYDAAAHGIILSAFFWGYLWPQLLGGWMSDRFGGRRVLAFGVAVWSIATLLTPPASVSFGLLIAMRVLARDSARASIFPPSTASPRAGPSPRSARASSR